MVEVYIPENEFGIAEGSYTLSQIAALLRVCRDNPEEVQFIADMLEGD